jgi:hypothetical protein
MGAYSVELSTVTRAELYAQARKLGVPGRSRMNKEELAWAIHEQDHQAVKARRRHAWPSAATPAVFRTLAWRSVRMVPPLAGVLLSAAIGATTPMLIVDSPGELNAVMRGELPAAYAQPAGQPRAIRAVALTPTQEGAPSSRGTAPTVGLAEASGGSSTGMPSASQPVGEGTEAPSGESGPSPSGPPQAGEGDEPGGESEDPGDSRGDPGEGDGSGEEGGSSHGRGSDGRSDGDADEHGKGKKGHEDKGKEGDEGKGKGEDNRRNNGHDKGKDGDNGKGKEGQKSEG